MPAGALGGDGVPDRGRRLQHPVDDVLLVQQAVELGTDQAQRHQVVGERLDGEGLLVGDLTGGQVGADTAGVHERRDGTLVAGVGRLGVGDEGAQRELAGGRPGPVDVDGGLADDLAGDRTENLAVARDELGLRGVLRHVPRHDDVLRLGGEHVAGAPVDGQVDVGDQPAGGAGAGHSLPSTSQL